MKWINKSAPPPKLTWYRKQPNASYEDMDSDVKSEVYDFLRAEQKNTCAYCNQILKDSFTIEHHCEQTICNGSNGTTDLRLDYTNMLGVCDGKASKLELHCDKKKAQFNTSNGLPIKLNPLIKSHTATISYTSTGLVKSSNNDFDNELNNLLNLNLSYLKALRKAKWTTLHSVCFNKSGKKRGLDKTKLVKILRNELNTNNYVQSFPGLSEFLIKKYE